MTTPREIGWQDAILAVLQQADEPLDYNEITRLIGERSLRTLTGATPATTVNRTLGLMIEEKRVARTGRGLYALPEVAQTADEEDNAEVLAAEFSTSDSGQLTVNAYGLYWERGLVDWNPTNGHLLGQQTEGAIHVDFADQDGVYFLHNSTEIAYVGQSFTPDTNRAGLYRRLRSHHRSSRKSDRWDTFTWFGFRPVADSGQLLPAPESASVRDVINLIEGIVIECAMPRLNMRRGEGAKSWEPNLYNQVEDPALIARRFAALAQVGSALR